MERILKNIVENDNGCWIWKKSLSSSGYGQLMVNKRYWSAHSYAFYKKNGYERAAGLHIRHTCHNRACCNPDHLIVGTPKDNYNDSRGVYREANKRKRKTWIVDGVRYATCREAVDKTGICMNSIIKYTKNGVFDRESYEKGCLIGKTR